MTIKEIKKLAEQSFTYGNLDVKKIKKVISLLGKKQLKTYIKFLKKLENENLVWVFTPIGKVENKITGKIKNMFPNKKVKYVADYSLIAGLRVIDNDMIYELNLKDFLGNMITYLKQSYK